MPAVRVIPVVLYDGLNAVKTIRYDTRRNVGSLLNQARVYAARDVDELVLIDLRPGFASDRVDIISRFADELPAPLTYGGSIRSVTDAYRALKAGADRVIISSSYWQAARETALELGSQAVVYAIDMNGSVQRRSEHRNLADCLHEAVEAEVGEVLLTQTQNDGVRTGYDVNLIAAARAVCPNLSIIANGGCGSIEHAVNAMKAGASAVAASSVFLYTEITPRDIRNALGKAGYEVRP